MNKFPISMFLRRDIQNRQELLATLDDFEYLYLGSGSFRQTYMSPDKTHVIKVISDYDDGNADTMCRREAYYYRRWREGKPNYFNYEKIDPEIQLARCRYVKKVGLFMEAVDPYDRYTVGKNTPDWAKKYMNSCVDSASFRIIDGQIGKTKDGRIVCYDYSGYD